MQYSGDGSADHVTQLDRDWYSLEDQVAHKLEYLRKHASNKDSLFLVGHSIGSWMILQMLQKLEPSRVKKVALLFPTIEKMGITPNGQKLAPLFSTLRRPFTALVWLLSSFPNFFRRFVLNHYFHTTPSEHVEHMSQATMNITSDSMYNILRMAYQEMDEVVEPPLHVIDKLCRYPADNWLQRRPDLELRGFDAVHDAAIHPDGA